MPRGSLKHEDADFHPVEDIQEAPGGDSQKFDVVDDCTPTRVDTDQVGCEVCRMAWEFLVETVRANFPNLLPHFEVALSVCGVLGICELCRPVAVIFEGESGAGKTVILDCISGVHSREAKEYLYRSDKFTPASFVSQAANVSTKALTKVDMLPQIRNKILVTPEMGPMFRGKTEVLEGTFAVFARVMDGRGLTCNSGVHGKRGYTDERYVFGWLGASTYLLKSAFDVMANVGNRLFFFDVSPPRPTPDEVTDFLCKGGSRENTDECICACDYLLSHFYSEHMRPGGGLLEHLLPSRSIGRYVATAARAISRLRGRGEGRSEYEFRIAEQLLVLVTGRALIEGLNEILPTHLKIVKHITFSAARAELRPILNALIRWGHKITVSEIQALCSCSKETALSRMKQLASTGVCKYFEGKAPNRQSGVELAPGFAMLATGSGL